ncbi:hypothetical protein [Pleionea litopenaei]|uniref:Uncharacterized protein n=1 Tax=Pleionea litopenaei TaxID=3070815 RepID=A0AA51RTR3_9GAMM|nr:hypothetical protein [Pleionea sp. HL-JVS1]WMS87498.1 hypothetical protein Q9312_00875 [Pleionea sp. HL-JVS1]
MKNYFVLVVLIVSLVLPKTVNAVDATGELAEVDFIYTTVGGSVFISLSPNSMPGCYNNRAGYIEQTTPENLKNVLSTFLAAQAGKRQVRVLYNYTTATSGWNMCRIQSVYLY